MRKQPVSTVTKARESYEAIRAGIVDLLKAAWPVSARSVNAVITATYWEIGRRIAEQEQSGAARAHYGDELIKQLATDLPAHFGRGFGGVNLSQMKRFFLTWPYKIFQTVSEKSSIPHSIVRLLTVKRPEARIFYEREALRSGWPFGSPFRAATRASARAMSRFA